MNTHCCYIFCRGSEGLSAFWDYSRIQFDVFFLPFPPFSELISLGQNLTMTYQNANIPRKSLCMCVLTKRIRDISYKTRDIIYNGI